MRKALIILLLFIACKANAQSNLLIKLNYRPNQIYETMDSTTVSSMHYSEKIEGSGKPGNMTKPVFVGTTVLQSNIMLTTQTKEQIADRIPFVTKNRIQGWVQQINGERNESSGPSDQSIVYGYFTNTATGYRTKVDSIQGSDIDDNKRNFTKSVFEQYTSPYPEKPIYIGDSFAITKEEEIVFGNLGVAYFELSTKYTLHEIKNGIGYFKKEHSLRLKGIESTNPSFKLTEVDQGTGMLEYDIVNSLIRSNTSTFAAVAKAEMDKLVITIHTTVKQKESIELR